MENELKVGRYLLCLQSETFEKNKIEAGKIYKIEKIKISHDSFNLEGILYSFGINYRFKEFVTFKLLEGKEEVIKVLYGS